MAAQVGENRADNTAEAERLSASLALGPDEKSRIRVLIVDDEHTLRESGADVLRLDGYDVTICARGAEALELMQRQGFDVAMVDLDTSQVDRLTLVRAALATNPDTLFILMTGTQSIESSLNALRQGGWDYLPKPFSTERLQILIGRAADKVLVSQETREQRREFERRVEERPFAVAGPSATARPPGDEPGFESSYHAARERVIARFETQYLTWLVNRAGGNMSKAARIAGVDRTTLYRLMERHGLHRGQNAAWVVGRR